jgi:hypothetical protein
VERSLQRGAGHAPDQEHKETYTHSSFQMRKRGIAYPSRDARRRNPQSSCLVQRRGSPRKGARARPLIQACRVGIEKFPHAGVCVMQSTNTYLELLHERGQRGLPLQRVDRQRDNTHLYLTASGQI